MTRLARKISITSLEMIKIGRSKFDPQESLNIYLSNMVNAMLKDRARIKTLTSNFIRFFIE